MGKGADYSEENLSKLYKLEQQRETLNKLAEGMIRKGDQLTSTDLLRQSAEIERLINEHVLGRLVTEEETENDAERLDDEKR